MKNTIKRLLPRGIKDYVRDIHQKIATNADRIRDLESRTGNLERAVDILISSPVYASSDDVGFNGQLNRKQIFLDLLSAISFKSIIETGTFMGDSTGFMAETSDLPVYTSELNPRFYMIARKRLSAFKSISFNLGDSRAFLRAMAEKNIPEPAFFYLDAHWYADLPLEDECNLVLSRWQNAVIMIDDFKVPNDGGYGYDDYGDGRILSLDYLSDIIKRNQLAIFFPSTSSIEETGAKRGCVVLARKGALDSRIKTSKLLIRATD